MLQALTPLRLMLDPDYHEIDSSPLASMTLRFFAELQAEQARTDSNFWEHFCELNASAPECLIYDV